MQEDVFNVLTVATVNVIKIMDEFYSKEDYEKSLYKNLVDAYSRNDEWAGFDQANAREALDSYYEASSYQGGI